MKKLDLKKFKAERTVVEINNSGDRYTEFNYSDGKIEELADKINEIIDFIKTNK